MLSRHLEPQQLPPAVAQHQKREQSLKGQGRSHKRINGRVDRLRVVPEECLAALRRRPTRTTYLDTVDWATSKPSITVIQTSRARSLPRSRRRGGACDGSEIFWGRGARDWRRPCTSIDLAS